MGIEYLGKNQQQSSGAVRQFTFALIACSAALTAMPGRADIVHAENVIMFGDLCAGSTSCVDGENFSSNIGGADIKVKSNDPQIWFQDTGGGGGLVDFGIEANFSNLGLYDVTNNSRVISFDGGSMADSIFIQNGKAGLFTNTLANGVELTINNSSGSVVDLHMVTGTVVWETTAEDSRYSIASRDALATVTPFVIEGDAPTNTLFLDDTGNIGMGAGSSPGKKLTIQGTDDALTTANSTMLQLQNSSGVVGTRVLFNLINNGGVRFDMLDQATGNNWVFQNQVGTFDITLAGTGTREFRFNPNGNLEISGSLIQSSSRTIKNNIEAVDELSVLERVVELPIHSWSYIKEPGVTHVGPMAEDFYDSFGLGGTNKGISSVDTGGVALAAIQGLKREKDREVAQLRAEKDRSISELKAENAALKAGLEQWKGSQGESLRSENLALKTHLEELRDSQEARMLQLEMALSELRRNQSREVKLGSAG